MAITASQVGTANTLEQFRVQYNNLQTDVSGLESGTLSYTALSATTISVSELTVTSTFSAVSFILEGATDDDFETTLSVVDPTADRTVSLPNATTTLVGKDTTDTLTNKTLTTPVITEIDSGSTITLDATTDIVLDADGADIFLKDGGTQFGKITNNSGELRFTSSSSDTTAMSFSGANVTIAGDLTVSGDDITLGTNTDTAIMVADGTNYNPVVPSGDIGLTNAGVFSIASGVILNADINASAAIVDTKLATITTANKVGLASVDIDGGTDIGADLTTSDLIVVDDGAGGTNRKAALSRMITLVSANIDDPTALAIALG
jgi:hypothetical protein